MTPDPIAPAPATSPPETTDHHRVPSRPRQWVIDLLLLIILCGVAIGFDGMRRAPTSPVYPGIMALPPDVQISEPPSMDEVWILAVSTGRGSPFGVYPHDELIRQVPPWTSLAGRQPWWKIWTTVEGVAHPPLYFLTLRAWRAIFGETDGAAIGLSMAWSCVTLVFIYLGVRLALGRPSAFWAAAAFAVAPTVSYFALEIRNYSILTAEAAIAIWLLVRLTLHGPRRRDVIGLCATLLACMLTHYFGVFACVVAGGYALAISGRRWPRVLLCGVATAVIYAVIWLPLAIKQFHFAKDGLAYLKLEQPHPWWSAALTVLLPFRLLAESWIWPPVGVSIVGCVLVWIGVTWVAVRRPLVRPLVLWFYAVTGYLLATDLLRHTQQLSFIRYSGAAQPAAVAFVQILAAGLIARRWVVHLAGAGLCVAAVLAQPNAMRSDAPVFTPAALAIAPLMDKDDVLLICRNPEAKTTAYIPEALVLEFAHVPGCMPRDVVMMERPMSAELAQTLHGRRAWLLPLTPEIDPLVAVPGATLLRQQQYWVTLDSPTPVTAYRLQIPGN